MEIKVYTIQLGFSNRTKRLIKFFVIFILAVFSLGIAISAPVNLPHRDGQIAAGQPISASHLWNNFFSLETAVNTADSSITALQAADTALNLRVDGNDSDITALQAADTALNLRVDGNDSDITALQAADTALNLRVDGNDSDITALQAADTALQGVDSAHDARIVIVENNMSPVGTVISSLLTVTQFQAATSTDWVLADGSNVAGSQYETLTGNANVPDLRGMFVRGKNNGRNDGNENPGGDLVLGAFENYKTAMPTTVPFETSTDGAHTHDVLVPLDDGGGGSNTIGGGADFGGASTTITSDLQGAHSHTIASGGDDETSPRNVTVNYFIRIN